MWMVYPFCIGYVWQFYWGWFCDHPVTILFFYGMTILGFLTTYWRLCVNILGPYFVWYMTIPELGMIGYHPGTVGGLFQPACFVWQFYWGWLWPSCDHTLYGIWPSYKFWQSTGNGVWPTWVFFSDNLLEIVCDHYGIAVVLFSTEFFILTGVWHWRSSLV